jgi:membrane protein implicated in regulation of membrane protease activity
VRSFGRYLLWQVPGWVIAGGIVFVVIAVSAVPVWVGVVALALVVVKDLALYPAMRVVFKPAHDSRLVGETGEAVEDLSPTGYISVAGELWKATVRDGRTVPSGVRVHVVATQGMTLLVESADTTASGGAAASRGRR